MTPVAASLYGSKRIKGHGGLVWRGTFDFVYKGGACPFLCNTEAAYMTHKALPQHAVIPSLLDQDYPVAHACPNMLPSVTNVKITRGSPPIFRA